MDGLRLIPISIDFTPKTYDIDFANHVSNIVYIRWLEDLRFKWLEKYFPIADQMAQNIAPTLLRTEIDYKRQIKLSDNPVKGTMWIGDLGRLKYVLEAEFTVNGKIMCQAKQTGIFVRTPEMKPIRTPELLKQVADKSLNELGENLE